MTNKLKQYFPILHTEKDLIQIIFNDPHLTELFQSWTSDQQREFLSFCTGARGVKILYDSFFKEILNPENTPERLEDFLSLLLGKHIKILMVLPNDSSRIADENSLLVMDILIQLKNGSLANIEVQKIGYAFLGQRCACYSADLLLRQYKRVRSEKKKSFSYRDIKSVYTIILFEKSPSEFHAFPLDYLHFFQQKSNTGLQMELLQKYLLIPLDIFLTNLHNKGICNKLDAWLAFLSCDDPEIIIQIIKEYPEFKPMYHDIYAICQNVERVMELFSKELLELDRNTVQYMIDEMQETIDKQKAKLEQQEKLSLERDELYQQALQRIAQLESQTKR